MRRCAVRICGRKRAAASECTTYLAVGCALRRRPEDAAWGQAALAPFSSFELRELAQEYRNADGQADQPAGQAGQDGQQGAQRAHPALPAFISTSM